MGGSYGGIEDNNTKEDLALVASNDFRVGASPDIPRA
jgi:hypothetical protein